MEYNRVHNNNMSYLKDSFWIEGVDMSCNSHVQGVQCGCDYNACVRRVPIFRELIEEERKLISSLVVGRDYQPKEIVFRPEEIYQGLMIIRQGKIKLVRYGMEGKEVILDILGAGDFFGTESLFHESKSRDYMIAMEPTHICFLPSAKIKEVILGKAHIGLKMLEYYSLMVDRNKRIIELLAIKDSYTRVAQFLLDRSDQINSSMITLSQEDIGNLINLTGETVNRCLSKMKKEGIINKGHKQIVIINEHALGEIVLNQHLE